MTSTISSSIAHFLSERSVSEDSVSTEYVDVSNLSWAERLKIVLQHRFTEYGLTFVILANFVVCIVEVDSSVDDAEPTTWMLAVNYSFSAMYTVETLLRMYAFGRCFWSDVWSVTDAFIVFVDDMIIIVSILMADALPSVSTIRLIRLLRLSRSKRLMRTVPQFYIHAQSLCGAIKPMFWGLCFTFFTLTVFGIVGVTVIHPINREVSASGAYGDCERCPHAFESVSKTVLTLSQHLLAGDSWGVVSIPIIEHEPASAIYFMSAYVMVCLTLLNIILATLVDESSQVSSRLIAQAQARQRRDAQKSLTKMFRELDTDQSGHLSKDELEVALTSNSAFSALLRNMNINSEDLDVVWNLIDVDKDGCINYHEFGDQLYKMKCDDTHTIMMFIEYHVSDIRSRIMDEVNRLNSEVLSKIHDLSRRQKEEMALLASANNTAKVNFVEVSNLGNSPQDLSLSPAAHTSHSSPRAPSTKSKSEPKLIEPPLPSDVDVLLERHWIKQQQLLVELATSLNVPIPCMHNKDGSWVAI